MERFDEHFVSVDKQPLLRIMDQNNRDSQWPIHSKKLVIPYSIMDEQLYEGKQIRRRSLLSREDFAKQIGVSFTTVNRWEAGKSKPSFKALRNIDDYCKKEKIDFNTGDYSVR